jgi:integrase/recombinase XerC
VSAPTLNDAAAVVEGAEVRWLLRSVRPEQWVAMIDAWSAWLLASGIRERTVELRRYQLGHLGAAHLDRSPWSLRTADLVEWLAGQAWAPETRKSYRSALRSFYGWGVSAGHTRHDPAGELRPVRCHTPPPRPAPDQVLDDALAAASDRDRLILLLAAYAGMRRAEIAGARWRDITAGAIRVTGKGGRVRVVPLHPVLRAELIAEHERRRAGSTGTGYRYAAAGDLLAVWLFPGQTGSHMAPHSVGHAASRLLGPGWTAHTLRHRFATRALRGTSNLLVVQQLLGHSSPETTMRYTALVDDALSDAVRTV